MLSPRNMSISIFCTLMSRIFFICAASGEMAVYIRGQDAGTVAVDVNDDSSLKDLYRAAFDAGMGFGTLSFQGEVILGQDLQPPYCWQTEDALNTKVPNLGICQEAVMDFSAMAPSSWNYNNKTWSWHKPIFKAVVHAKDGRYSGIVDENLNRMEPLYVQHLYYRVESWWQIMVPSPNQNQHKTFVPYQKSVYPGSSVLEVPVWLSTEGLLDVDTTCMNGAVIGTPMAMRKQSGSQNIDWVLTITEVVEASAY